MPARKPSKARAKGKNKFDVASEVRAIARERVGTVKPSRIIPSRTIKDKRTKKQDSPIEEGW